MSKRASNLSPSSVAKRSKVDTVAEKISTIAGILNDEAYPHVVPKAARAMLVCGAEAALGTTVEERHVLQDQVISHFREALDGVQEGLKRNVAEEKRLADSIAADMEMHTAQLQVAVSDAETAHKAWEAQVDKFNENASAVVALEGDMLNVEICQGSNTAARGTIEKAKEKHMVIDGNMQKLIAGECGDEVQVKKAITKLVNDFTHMGAEAACLATIPSVLGKKPEERGGFDSMVMDSLTGMMAERLKEIDNKLLANDAEKAQLDADAKSKGEAIAAAIAAKEASKSALDTAEGERDEKAMGKEAKEACIEKDKLELSNHTVGAEVAECNVTDFGRVLGTFEELCSRSSTPRAELDDTRDPKAAEMELTTTDAGTV